MTMMMAKVADVGLTTVSETVTMAAVAAIPAKAAVMTMT